MSGDFKIVAGFPEHCRAEAARLFWNAFHEKLGRVLGPETRALCLLERLLDPDFAVSALSEDGRLLGMAGYKTGQGALVGGTLADMCAVYGLFGGLWRGVLLEILERDPEPDQLLMDGLFVHADARGLGIGTVLLNAVCDTACDQD